MRARLWLVRVWFLEIAFVQELSMCVCVSAPEAMNNLWPDLWHDMKPE